MTSIPDNTIDRKQLAAVRKLLGHAPTFKPTADDAGVIKQGLLLVRSIDNPALWQLLAEGVSVNSAGTIEVASGSEVHKRVHAEFREFVGLWALRETGRLTSVKTLKLRWGRGLSDLTALAELSALQHLEINRCEDVTDLSPLRHLTGLQSLSLGFCSTLADLTPLQSLSSLRALRLAQCRECRSLHGLETLVTLDELTIDSWGQLTDVSALKGLSSLTSLTLKGCDALIDLSPLGQLSALRTLVVCGGYHSPKLTDLTPLQGLSALESLDLSRNEQIRGLEPLRTLTSLKRLNISQCEAVSSLAGIEELLKLTDLQLEGCRAVTDLAPLSNLSALESVNLRGCRELTDLSPLRVLPSLRSLTLPDGSKLVLKALVDFLGADSSQAPISTSPTRRFEYEDESSRKFWEITISGSMIVIRFGAYFTDGQRREQKFESLEAAQATAKKKIAEKLKSGYREVGGKGTLSEGDAANSSLSGEPMATSQPSQEVSQASTGADRKTLSEIRKLLGQDDLAAVRQGIALMRSLGNPSLWETLVEGTFVSASGEIIVPAGSEIQKRVKAAFRIYVGLSALAETGRLKNVQSLNISRSGTDYKYPLLALPDIRRLATLQSLDLSFCSSLTDIHGVEGHPLLQTLDLSHCRKLTDLSPLRNLSALQTLNLHGCEALEDLRPLEGLPNLKSLKVGYCKKLADFSPLRNIPTLETLDTTTGRFSGPTLREFLAS